MLLHSRKYLQIYLTKYVFEISTYSAYGFELIFNIMEGAENESDINAKNMVAFGENNVERTKFWLTSI